MYHLHQLNWLRHKGVNGKQFQDRIQQGRNRNPIGPYHIRGFAGFRREIGVAKGDNISMSHFRQNLQQLRRNQRRNFFQLLYPLLLLSYLSYINRYRIIQPIPSLQNFYSVKSQNPYQDPKSQLLSPSGLVDPLTMSSVPSSSVSPSPAALPSIRWRSLFAAATPIS